MIHSARDLLQDHRRWQSLLAAYRAEEAAAKNVPASTEENPQRTADETSSAGWIPRLAHVEGLSEDELPKLHGQLIAHGLLKFKLLGRHEGLGYRVSQEARQALHALEIGRPHCDEETSSDEHPSQNGASCSPE